MFECLWGFWEQLLDDRSIHPPSSILKAYMKALPGLSHRWSRWSQQYSSLSRLRPWKHLPLWKRWTQCSFQGRGRGWGAPRSRPQVIASQWLLSTETSHSLREDWSKLHCECSGSWVTKSDFRLCVTYSISVFITFSLQSLSCDSLARELTLKF